MKVVNNCSSYKFLKIMQKTMKLDIVTKDECATIRMQERLRIKWTLMSVIVIKFEYYYKYIACISWCWVKFVISPGILFYINVPSQDNLAYKVFPHFLQEIKPVIIFFLWYVFLLIFLDMAVSGRIIAKRTKISNEYTITNKLSSLSHQWSWQRISFCCECFF